MSSSRMTRAIVLESSDGKSFQVKEAVASESKMIRDAIAGGNFPDITIGIPLPNVTGKILEKVIQYCERRVYSYRNPSPDAELLDVDLDALFEIVLAAKFLEIDSLLNLSILEVCKLTANMTPGEVRKTFHIPSEFTPEEEEIRKECMEMEEFAASHPI